MRTLHRRPRRTCHCTWDGWMKSPYVLDGRTDGEQKRRETLVRTVSCRRCRFQTRLRTSRAGRARAPEERRGPGADSAADTVATLRERTEAGSTRGRCLATGTQSAGQEVRARRAHVGMAEVAAPSCTLLPPPPVAGAEKGRPGGP